MKKIIFTDLDGTLTKRSLVLEHCGFLINKGIIPDDGSYDAWKDDVKNEKLIFDVATNYRHQITGKTIDELKVKEFIKYFSSHSRFWYNDMLDRLALEKDSNTDIWLITGSADFLVKELADLWQVNYKATTYTLDNGKLTGNIYGMFSEDQKDDFVKNYLHSKNYDIVEGWGDTSSDNGIFKNANYSLLVEPTQQTTKFFEDKNIDEVYTENA